MKHKKREANTFSMSAVDLFASAMGAFILLAVIALPFFPKVSSAPPTPPAPACPDPVICPVCEVCPPVPEKSFALKDIDLVIVLDVTGSMKGSLDGLKSTARDLMQLLARLAPTFGIGMVTFGDYGYDQPTVEFPLREIRTPADPRAFEGFVNRITLRQGKGSGGNNRDGEALSAGLEIARDMNFRADSRDRRIIIFTDDVPTYENRAIQLARQFAAGSRGDISQTVSVVATEPPSVPTAPAVLKNLASQGNGLFSQSEGSFIGQLLLALFST